jgi:CheY-like chemotaxis protein
VKNQNPKPAPLLLAEDDPDDCLLIRQALEKSRLSSDLRCVEDGEDLLDYLRHHGKFADPKQSPRPGLILLDLNMPRKDGREALREIKNDPKLRTIPIVVLTTSKSEEDVERAYNLGVNSYIIKPVRFAALVEVMQAIDKYWFEIVELPGRPQANPHG